MLRTNSLNHTNRTCQCDRHNVGKLAQPDQWTHLQASFSVVLLI